jgi:LacI family transcriptional regulator
MRVTIRDLAREADVHHTTVSRALRNDPRLASATRERLLQLARDRGYVPDPMLCSLMSYRKRIQPPRYQATLAWVTSYPTADGWRRYEKVEHFRGAVRRAKELGYEVGEFWLNQPGITQKRMTEILSARNINGLLMVNLPRARVRLKLDWSRFIAVTFGHQLVHPHLSSATTHHFRSMRLVMRRLKQLGYRRIGFACWPRILESVDRNWTGAYLAYQMPLARPIPVYAARLWNKASFRQWLKKHRPDVVISNDFSILDWLREMGLRVPEDIGFAVPSHAPGPQACSGIDENNEMVGAMAVDMLVEMIQRGDRGIPQVPHCELIEGTWIEGSTVRRVFH